LPYDFLRRREPPNPTQVPSRAREGTEERELTVAHLNVMNLEPQAIPIQTDRRSIRLPHMQATVLCPIHGSHRLLGLPHELVCEAETTVGSEDGDGGDVAFRRAGGGGDGIVVPRRGRERDRRGRIEEMSEKQGKGEKEEGNEHLSKDVAYDLPRRGFLSDVAQLRPCEGVVKIYEQDGK
jgi:hypothetical protein